MENKLKIGKWGEDLAVKYLRRKGYKVVERNVQLSHKELDIVAKKRGIYIFVEVKTRIDYRTGEQANPLNQRKIKYLKKAIKMYVSCNHLDPEKVRLDLVCVDIDYQDESANITHYSDIF